MSAASKCSLCSTAVFLIQTALVRNGPTALKHGPRSAFGCTSMPSTTRVVVAVRTKDAQHVVDMHTDSPARLSDLLHFATRRDMLMIGTAALLFFVSGTIQATLNLFLSQFIAVGPGQSLTDAGRNAFIVLGGLLGSTMFLVFLIGSVFSLL